MEKQTKRRFLTRSRFSIFLKRISIMKLGTTDISAIKLGSTGISKAYLGSSVVYEESTTEYTGFYVEDVSGSENTLSISKINSNAPTLTIEKSTNGRVWSTIGQTSTTPITATVPANGKLYLRCSTDYWSKSFANTITCTGNYNVGGNTMSLLYGSSYTGNETSFPGSATYQLCMLFWNSTTLISAENLLLPATTLTNYCYCDLFSGCSSLTSMPSTLPATTLATACYSNMFYRCTSLTSIPSNYLPVTTMAERCYQNMFSGCTGLRSVPYNLLPATTLADYCYSGMLYGCSSITKAPLLPASTLKQFCYQNLFYNCSSLNEMFVCFGTDPNWSNSSATDYRATYLWTYGLPSSGTYNYKTAVGVGRNKSGNKTIGSNSSTNFTNGYPYNWSLNKGL